MKQRKPNTRALAAFMAKKGEIDAMIKRIAALSDDHFAVSPDEVTWGDVGCLDDYAALLKRISDAAFHEGEHAD